MRQRLRPHLTFANIVSAVALFVALGGTAAAAVIITDNSQVAPNTISGHRPPSGDHANIIGGSITAQDVANNGLGGRVIAEPTLTGNARKLLFSGGFVERKKIATVGPYTIKVSCAQSPHVTGFNFYVNGPAGTANYMFITRENDSQPAAEVGSNFLSQSVPIPAHQDALLFDIHASTGFDTPASFERFAGTVMIRSGSWLVQLDLDSVAYGASGNCTLNGTGTRAT